MRARVALCLAAIIALAGCASIPLSTALSMSKLSPRSLAQLDPAEVAVIVSLPVGFELDVPATRLNLELRGADASRKAAMGLAVVSVSRGVRSGGLFSADVPVSNYRLRLTPEGNQQLQTLQRFILTGDPTEFSFSLNVPFADMPASASELTFWADLQLTEAEGFKPLIDGATIEFTDEKTEG